MDIGHVYIFWYFVRCLLWDKPGKRGCLIKVLFCFVLFFCGTRVWTQGFTLEKQALYCLSHTSSLFCFFFFSFSTRDQTRVLYMLGKHFTTEPCPGYFGMGLTELFCLGWPWTEILPISASQVPRIAEPQARVYIFKLSIDITKLLFKNTELINSQLDCGLCDHISTRTSGRW
jgi:hypothetical protein